MKQSLFMGACQGVGVLGVFLLALAVAVAADILTVDKDGTIRLRVSDTGKVTLNTNEPAQGDMRFTPRTADPTAPLEGDIWYNNAEKTAKLADGTIALPVPGKFQRYTAVKQDGDFQTTSTDFVDVPALSVTLTTDYPNQTVAVSFTGRALSWSAGGAVYVDMTLDGTSLSETTYGFTGHRSDAAGSGGNVSFTIYHTIATAGNHTIRAQAKSNNASYTAVIQGQPTSFASRIEALKFF